MWMNNCCKQSHTYLHKYTQFSSSIYSEKCQPWPVLGLVSEICHNNFSCYYYHFWHSLHFKKVSWCISQLPVYFWNSWWGTRGSPSRDGRFCAADHLDDLIDMSWECRRRPDTLHGVNLYEDYYIASSIFPVSGFLTAPDGSFLGFCKVDLSYQCLVVLHCWRQKQMMHEREEGKVDLYICELPIDDDSEWREEMMMMMFFVSSVWCNHSCACGSHRLSGRVWISVAPVLLCAGTDLTECLGFLKWWMFVSLFNVVGFY